MTSSRSLIWKILAASISLVSLAWGFVMADFCNLFHPQNLWAMSTSAYMSFGLFGFPTTLIPLAMGAVIVWFGPRSWSAEDGMVHWVGTIGFVLAYLVQWQFLAWMCFKRSRRVA